MKLGEREQIQKAASKAGRNPVIDYSEDTDTWSVKYPASPPIFGRYEDVMGALIARAKMRKELGIPKWMP